MNTLDLILEARKGCPTAAENLVIRFEPKLAKHISRANEEAFQEALTVLLNGLPKFKPTNERDLDNAVVGYLIGICKRLIKSERRRASRAPATNIDPIPQSNHRPESSTSELDLEPANSRWPTI